MFRFKTTIAVIVMLLIMVSISHGYRKVGRTDKTQKSTNSKNSYTPIKYNFLIKGAIGYFINSNDDFPAYFQTDQKIFYGFGFSGEYHTVGKHAFGINYDRLFYSYDVNTFSEKLLVQVYSLSYIYKFKTEKTSIPIFTLNFGTAKPDLRNATSAKTVKVGLGFIGHTGSITNIKSVLYYQRFFSSDELDQYLDSGKLKVIGLDIFWGIPL